MNLKRARKHHITREPLSIAALGCLASALGACCLWSAYEDHVEFQQSCTNCGDSDKLAADYGCEHHRFTIGPSTVPGAGNGVFANSEMQRNSLCCFFDGKQLSFDDFVESPNLSRSDYVLFDNHGRYRDGYRTPRSSCGVSQLINDGSMYVIYERTTLKAAAAALNDYLHESKRKANTIFDPNDAFLMRTTRNVAAGEELFVSYGEFYWLAYASKRTRSPFVRMLALMLQPEKTKQQMVASQYVYNETQGAIIMADGKALAEETAEMIVNMGLCMKLDSVLWTQLGLAESSATVKLAKLIDYLRKGGETLSVEFDESNC